MPIGNGAGALLQPYRIGPPRTHDINRLPLPLLPTELQAVRYVIDINRRSDVQASIYEV